MNAPPVEGVPAPPPAGPLAGPLVREKITTTTVVEREYEPAPAPKQQRTMQSFFGGLRAGPSSAGAEAVPVPVLHPFPSEEITHMTSTVPRTDKGTPYHYIASRVKPDGSLVGQCACYRNHISLVKNTPQPIRNFTPGDNHNSGPNRAAFQAALDDYDAALAASDLDAAREARASIEALRARQCVGCKAPEGYLSPGEQACKDNWDRILGAMGLCVRCGEQQATQANHLPGKTKTLYISQYSNWPGKGGVSAQTKEFEECCEEICACCHQLDELSHSGNRIGDPRLMPRGKRSGTEEEIKAYHARLIAKIQYPKYLFHDRVKLEIGECFFSGKRVVAERVSNAREANVVCFDGDHFDPDGKLAARFQKETCTWIVSRGKHKGEKRSMRMSPTSWCRLDTKQHSLSKIVYSKLIPDQRRCRVTAHDVHCSWNRTGVDGPKWTLEQAEAYEALVIAAQQRVLDKYYGGKITEEHDYHSDGDEDDAEDGDDDGEEEHIAHERQRGGGIVPLVGSSHCPG